MYAFYGGVTSDTSAKSLPTITGKSNQKNQLFTNMLHKLTSN